VPGWEYLMAYRKDNYSECYSVCHSETSSGGHSQPGSGLQWDGEFFPFDGALLGSNDVEGCKVGVFVGLGDGIGVGRILGRIEGLAVGLLLGFWLGLLVGFDDGLPDGFTDGLALGDGVG
jgi:hypothetical protein